MNIKPDKTDRRQYRITLALEVAENVGTYFIAQCKYAPRMAEAIRQEKNKIEALRETTNGRVPSQKQIIRILKDLCDLHS